MCGRYSLSRPGQLALRFDLAESAPVEATYNAAPSEELPVIVEQEGRRMAKLMRWGLVPRWARDPEIGARLMNARAETVAEKPAFRGPLRRQRCLVPATGFYEWMKAEEGKLPYHIHRKDDELFAMAGLYDTWRNAGGELVQTYTVITTEANALLAPIHERMPVILPREAEQLWLDPEVQDASVLTALLRPYPPEELEAYRVSRRVNSARENDAALLKEAG